MITTSLRDTYKQSWRLIINQPQFLQQARLLLVDNNRRFATAGVRRRPTSIAEELIVDQWQIQPGIPSGLERPPMMDWAVMTKGGAKHSNWNEILTKIQPKRSQLLVLIQIDSRDHDKLKFAIWQDGSIFQPDEMRFIGTQMLTLSRSNNSVTPQTDGELRSSRSRGALHGLYDRLGEMVVVQIGAGGGGQELAPQLLSAGVRNLTLIDGDVLGPENLDRMPLAKASDIGQPKVVQLARSLTDNQPDATIRGLAQSILHSDSLRMLRSMRPDVLFSYIDSDIGRVAVSLLAREIEAIHIDVGSHIEIDDQGSRVMSADVRLFEPGLGCVACVPEMENLSDVLYHLSAPAGCMQRGQRRQWNEMRAGSLLHLNAVAASLAVETWLGWLSGTIRTSHWTRLRWQGLVPNIQSASVGPDQECRFCSTSRPS